MYYSKILTNEDRLLKNEILYSFMILESKHKSKRGEILQISLHSKNDFEHQNPEFWDKEIELFMKVDLVSVDVTDFVGKWGFNESLKMPIDLKHILGNFGSTSICLDRFIV